LLEHGKRRLRRRSTVSRLYQRRLFLSESRIKNPVNQRTVSRVSYVDRLFLAEMASTASRAPDSRIRCPTAHAVS
jgi:hypothetical protein